MSDRHSAADVESFHLAGYTGGMAGPFALRGGGAWTWNDIDTSRAVIFPGFFEREKASYDADTGQLFGEVAYPIAMGRTALEPFVGLAFVSIDTDSFKENGALAALRSRGVDENVGYSTLGLRAAATMAWKRHRHAACLRRLAARLRRHHPRRGARSSPRRASALPSPACRSPKTPR